MLQHDLSFLSLENMAKHHPDASLGLRVHKRDTQAPRRRYNVQYEIVHSAIDFT